MKMKRKVALLLAMVMLLISGLTACGSGEKASDAGETADATQDTDNTGDGDSQELSGDPDHIIVTFIYATTEPADLRKVEAAVNEITIPAINVEVEFKPLALGDSFTNYSLWISSGETIDLMMLFEDVKNYTNSGMLEPLDGYISEASTPTISNLMKEFPITTAIQGETYGMMAVNINYGNKPGLVMRKEWVEETGYEVKDTYSVEDVTNILAAIKEKHPDCYPFAVLGNEINPGSCFLTYMTNIELAGRNTLAGALLDAESETLVNFYETEEYKAYLQQLVSWYEAGYIMPDAATTDLSKSELLKNGKIAGYPMKQAPEMFGSEGYGFELTGLPLGGSYFGNAPSDVNFVVPVTSAEPQAAVRFMDYLYGNHDLSNLIMRGIEGEHYDMVDEENGFIQFANGYDGTTSPYYNLFGVWGDRRYEYSYNTDASRASHEAFTEAAMENKWKDYGFAFDGSLVSNQILSCQSVLDQYQKALETGTLGDKWEETYNKMTEQLKTAGIDEVIAECQSQLDDFLGK